MHTALWCDLRVTYPSKLCSFASSVINFYLYDSRVVCLVVCSVEHVRAEDTSTAWLGVSISCMPRNTYACSASFLAEDPHLAASGESGQVRTDAAFFVAVYRARKSLRHGDSSWNS